MSDRHYQHFLRRVHRRRLFIHTLENVGRCSLAACGFALPLLLVLLHREQPVGTAMGVIGLLSTIAAAVMTIHRHPSPLSTAIEIDHQLGWADLLATVVQLDRDSVHEDSMAASVLAIADGRCRDISPSVLILNHYGFRAWGGIGLALSAVLAVSLIPSHPIRSARAMNPEIGLIETGGESPEFHASSGLATLSPQGADEERNALFSDTNQKPAAPSGTGTVNSNALHSFVPPQWPSTGFAKPNSSEATTGILSSGGTDVNNRAGGIGPVPSRYSDSLPQKIVPWHASETATDLPPVTPGSVDNKIPAADRDLVRGYFDHD